MSTSSDVERLFELAIGEAQDRANLRIANLRRLQDQYERFRADAAANWTAARRSAFPARLRAALNAMGIDVTAIQDWSGADASDAPVVLDG